MTSYQSRLPTLAEVKTQARKLRSDIAQTNAPITHGRSLEMVAHQWGRKDWNTLRAAIEKMPDKAPFAIGNSISGTYLGQAFTGVVIGLQILGGGTRYRISLNLDAPIDVVKFDSFSAFRRRINGTVDLKGRSFEKTSDGIPQLVINL